MGAKRRKRITMRKKVGWETVFAVN